MLTLLSYLVRWLPFPLLAAVWYVDLGWWRAGVVALVCLAVRRHWIVAGLAAVAAVLWLDIPPLAFVWAVSYRLLWDIPGSWAFDALDRRRHRYRPEPVVPALRCRHGLQQRIAAADHLHSVGLADGATDAYLKVLADHPVEPECGRPLLLRTAEAAAAAGDFMLGAELATAAMRGIPPDPTGHLATIAVRAHTTRALALLGLHDLDGARAGLRLAQRLTQSDRSTDGYLRWTAVDVRLAGRPVRTTDELAGELGSALTQQELRVRDMRPLNRRSVTLAWRVLAAGDATAARLTFIAALHRLELDPSTRAIRGPGGRIKVPRDRQPSWRMFTRTIAGLVAASAAENVKLDHHDQFAADVAVSLAWYLDENVAGARMLLDWALLEHRLNGDADGAVAKLRRAQRFADYSLHTFADQRRQAEWVALRQEINAALATVAGIVEPPVTSPWPADPKSVTRVAATRAEAVTLFDRLCAADPGAFGPARWRMTNAPPTSQPPASVSAPVSVSAPAPVSEPVSEPVSVPVSVPTPAPYLPDPSWLEALAAVGGRCWAVPLALEHARALGHGHVGPEHVLLAVLGDGACARVLAGLGVPAAAVRATIASWYGPAEPAEPDLDPATTDLVRAARRIADARGETRIRPVNLLLALLADPDGTGAAVLRAHRIDLEEARVRLRAVPDAQPGPLFAAGAAVPEHRLTLPAWLAIGYALDLAADSPAGVLGTDHLIAGIAAYQDPGLVVRRSDRRETVRITPVARTALDGARRRADADGEWGIDLEHLRRATTAPRPSDAAEPGTDTQPACRRAWLRGAPFVTPDDVRAASAAPEQQDSVVGHPVPVLTPSARRAFRDLRERRAS
jgi:Clp amino terminal domain, pathogenicity island component